METTVAVNSTPERVWCEGCLTSARLIWDVLALTSEGVTVIGQYTNCQRCTDRTGSE